MRFKIKTQNEIFLLGMLQSWLIWSAFYAAERDRCPCEFSSLHTPYTMASGRRVSGYDEYSTSISIAIVLGMPIMCANMIGCLAFQGLPRVSGPSLSRAACMVKAAIR